MSETFPGWDALQAEQERKFKEQERKKQEKQRQKEQKRRNSLPPFLMVRAGCLRGLYPWLLLLGALIYVSDKSETPNAIQWVVWTLCTTSLTVGLIVAPKTFQTMQSEINTIKSRLNVYKNKSIQSDPLSTVADIKHKKLSRILTQHISKNNPEIFDKMLYNPESVADMETATNIILGHLKSTPKHAEIVLREFHCIPDNLQRKLDKLRFKTR